MYKLIQRAFIFLFSIGVIHAQPQPCGTPAEMTSFCDEACIICDINGFTGTNNSTETGWAPSTFCTNTQHNIQWIAFQAGSVDLTLNVAVSNCQSFGGFGLEVGIYLSTDCQNFQLVSNCDGEISENSSQNFTNNVPLVIGQYYYFVMDGNGGDICQYKVTVINGNTIATPLSSSGEITGPSAICENEIETYATTYQEAATYYDWTINGGAAGSGQSTDIDFGPANNYQLCVVASNVCDEAPPTCVNVEVVSIPPTLINGTICEGECFVAAGDTFCAGGVYPFTFTSELGCDSLVTVNVVAIPNSELSFSATFCDGDTLFVGNNAFANAGIYVETLTNSLGCDSVITFDISLITCEINLLTDQVDVACFGDATGEMSFTPTTGLLPMTYSWQQLGSALAGNGVIGSLNETTTVINLSAGTYLVTITNAFDEDAVAIFYITEPTAVQVSLSSTAFNGYEVACAGGNTGILSATATGGVNGFTYNWSNSDSGANISNLAAGTYTVTASDGFGCTATETFTLTEPAPIVFTPTFKNASCDGLTSGYITISAASGGIGPYLYSINGSNFTDTTVYTNILPGSYTMVVSDANACLDTVVGSIVAPIIPTVNILADSLEIDLADNVLLSAQAFGYDTLIWAGENLSCYDCLSPVSSAYWSGQYTLTAISTDSCVTKDSMYLTVNKVRKVFVPNAFSNNYDGKNDFLTIFAGPQVSQILEFKVFDRWGNKVFERQNFDPNQETLGWDGTYRGDVMNNSTFGWYAKILFIDSVVLEYEGDVSLLK